MPWIDADSEMNPPCDDWICDQCGKQEHWKRGGDVMSFWRYDIFKGAYMPIKTKECYCQECATNLTPLIYQLRDVQELRAYVNKLKKAINDKRNQNNRTITNSIS